MTVHRLRDQPLKDAGLSAGDPPWHRNSHLLFLLFNCAFAAFTFDSLRELFTGAWRSGYVTYIPFIPLITAYLIWSDRQRIFSQVKEVTGSAAVIVVAGAACYGLLRSGGHPEVYTVRFAFSVIAALSMWLGGFLLCYGPKTARAAAFPLLFLLFAVPIPRAMLDAIIAVLQRGSAEVSFALIRGAGIPVVREGFVFHMPSVTIEVAPQCSGIRSALSLVIVGSLAAHLFLRKGWTRAVLLLALLPITVVKNGLRIFVLTILSVHVDPGFLEGDLHQKGGIPFFVLALLMAGGVIALLRKGEGEQTRAAGGNTGHGN